VKALPPKVLIQNLNIYYRQKQALYDVNMEISEKQILAVFGPSNSGVTSLLRSLNRLCDLNPETRIEGRILLDGKNIRDPDINVTALRRRVGMVFDVPTPLPLSIFDNIAYGPRLAGVQNKKAIAQAVEQALRRSALFDDVKDRLKSPALSLSGGQQQRLCIARVLALEPEVILLDRPCSGLDPISTAKIEESLMQLSKYFTIVIAPHNVQQAGRICDRAAFILMGKLIEEGSNQEVFSNPKDKRTEDYITGRFG